MENLLKITDSRRSNEKDVLRKVGVKDRVITSQLDLVLWIKSRSKKATAHRKYCYIWLRSMNNQAGNNLKNGSILSRMGSGADTAK